jgi:hypothetical protein
LGANLEERRDQNLEGLRRKPFLGLSLHGEVFHGGLAITFVREHTKRGRVHMIEEVHILWRGRTYRRGCLFHLFIGSFLLERITLESRGRQIE